MNKIIKFKIGEFSKLCQVTVKTLRYYEDKGLLTPAEVDDYTGYRFYTIPQLRRMNQIRYFKLLGFSLEEITNILETEDMMPEIGEINKKEQDCLNQIRQMQWRLSQLKKLGNILLKKENDMQKIFEKTLPTRVFATHRCRMNSYQDLFNLCPNILGPEMMRLGCECPEPQYCFTVEYNEEYGVDIDIEYFEAVKEKKEDSDLIKFKELPEVPTALCINHYGAYNLMPNTVMELYAYAEANGYTIADHPRFSYIDGIWNKDNIEEWLTEIQLPINK